MAKKNTLKDLNEFMKQNPGQQEEGKDFASASPKQLSDVEEAQQSSSAADTPLGVIQQYAKVNDLNERLGLLSFILEVLDQKSSDLNSSDLMLKNTALYLQHIEQLLSDNS